MANNLTVEAPNFEKITKEAGQFTSDAVNTLWNALNVTRADLRRETRKAQEMVAPKVLSIAPAADVDDLDLQGASVLQFTGASAVNWSGARAPETGKTRVLFVVVQGAGTITFEHDKNSQAGNRLVNTAGADTAMATNAGRVYAYLSSRWRQVA